MPKQVEYVIRDHSFGECFEFLPVYHGSGVRTLTPSLDRCENMDLLFGKGFYLCTDSMTAGECAALASKNSSVYVHPFQLDLTPLNILDFRERHLESFVALILRAYAPYAKLDEAAVSLAESFVERYCPDLFGYDAVIYPRMSDAHVEAVLAFAGRCFDLEVLRSLFYGDRDLTVCCLTQTALDALDRLKTQPAAVDTSYCRNRFLERDREIRMFLNENLYSYSGSMIHHLCAD